ncbi:MAG: GNAT family N-acetyltransferase [Alphaproteobacteria bacterium]
MALLRSPISPEHEIRITGDGLYLRHPLPGDYEAWSRLRARSRAFLEPWEPVWPADDLTRGAFRRRLRRYQRDIREDTAYPFLIFRSPDDRMLGGCTLSNVRRGVAQAASLGYWVGEPFKNQGVMTRAVRALLPFAFDHLKLHRVEAACLPANEPSRRLLRRCGFTEEGYARAYLRINGAWQDHVLFAILQSDPRD